MPRQPAGVVGNTPRRKTATRRDSGKESFLVACQALGSLLMFACNGLNAGNIFESGSYLSMGKDLGIPVTDHGNDLVSFGSFEADLRAGELRRNGSKVRLQEQPFQVLTVLLERPGEIVTREELRNRLWPADTFVDFDHGLNAAVKRLRDALGDSAENPRFVETLARRGYRFVAPVAAKPNGASPVPQIITSPAPQKSRRGRIALATLSVLLMGTG